ncbi:MAG TPA: tripartite tricarboxylate transporter permease [Virgibacillus sp.]|nr:tripartite tricarboxylate transporter permease [Virgibacillus sp.]HLR68276.1 tripartite tricarboxylate transporter permease [Virgibacillus sp.]
MLEGLTIGLENIIQPVHLLILFLAVVIGFVGGATPGISGAMLILILLPVTYGMEAIPAFLLMTAIYSSTVYSGSISAILFRTPGTPEAIATVFDGYPMAQKGSPGKALGIAISSSAIGGTIGTIILIFLTPLLAKVALEFSSPEYFALGVLGLTVVASLSGKDLIRGLIGVLFGLFIATVGIDRLTGFDRFSFGNHDISSGISLVAALIGLFAISEVFEKSNTDVNIKQKMYDVKTKILDWKLIKKLSKTISRSSLIGTFIGILPGVGATTASIVAYSEEVRWSKEPERFGKGAPEGISAPETANNSSAMGAMVPLLALGIPGSVTTAIILGAFVLHGLEPGPMLLVNEKGLVYTIFIGLLLVNVLMLLFAKPFISIFKKTLKLPYSLLGPLILIFSFLGTYADRNSMFDAWIMLLFGFIGFYLQKIKFPLATIVLGIVLGPIVEEELRRSLQMSGGDIFVFFTRPISAMLLVVAIGMLFMPLIRKLFQKSEKAKN